MTKRKGESYFFDEKAAAKAVTFIERMKLSKGKYAGKPMILRPWQKKIVTDIFGWKREDETRRYRRAYFGIGRKNAKTHLGAAIANLMFFGDGEKGPEVYPVANSRGQAGILFRAALSMIRQEPLLERLCDIAEKTRRIYTPRNDGVFQVIAAEAVTSLGTDTSCVCYDEIAFAQNSELFDAISTSTGSREQPLQLYLTTASNIFNGIGHGLYKHAKAVAANPDIDPSFYPCIYELDEKADWTAEGKPGKWDDKRNDWKVRPTGWYAANPALGDFLNIQVLRDKFNEAMQLTSAQPGFRMFNLNQWVQSASSWLDVVKWNEMALAAPDLLENLKGQTCWAGLDLSAVTDLTALMLLFKVPDAMTFEGPRPKYILVPNLFMPEDNLRAKILKDHVPYDDWASQGFVTTTPGAKVDYGFVRQRIKEITDRGITIADIGFDPWQSHELVTDLEAAGYSCTPIRQGHQSLSDATKQFEASVLSYEIAHDGNPAMSWQVSNAVTRADANGNIVVDKAKSAHRVDGIAAGVMSLDRALRNPNPQPAKKKSGFRVTVFG